MLATAVEAVAARFRAGSDRFDDRSRRSCQVRSSSPTPAATNSLSRPDPMLGHKTERMFATRHRDLMINPPIFKLAAGEQQLVRVAPRGAPPPDVERAYRLVFSEVPEVKRPRQRRASASRSRWTFRCSSNRWFAAQPAVTWRLEHVGDRSRLVAENSGGRHLRLRDVQVLDGTRLARYRRAHRRAGEVVVRDRSARDGEGSARAPTGRQR